MTARWPFVVCVDFWQWEQIWAVYIRLDSLACFLAMIYLSDLHTVTKLR